MEIGEAWAECKKGIALGGRMEGGAGQGKGEKGQNEKSPGGMR